MAFYNAPVIRTRITFRGRVQGVGFRATARHVASRYPVIGWVSNEPDGSVTVEIQGAHQDIESFLADLRAHFVRGITSESRENAEARADETAFVIRR